MTTPRTSSALRVFAFAFLLAASGCGSPTPTDDGGTGGGSMGGGTGGGSTGGGTGGGSTGGGTGGGSMGGGTGGGSMGGGTGGGAMGGGGGDDAGMDDAGMDDAGIDAGMDDAGVDDAGVDDAGVDDAGVDDAGTMVCVPNSTASCYSGPVGTQGVGICMAGTKTCLSDGSGYGGCTGDVVPTTESCANATDDNCDGVVNEGCTTTYATNAKPIFQAKCSPCHTGGGSGGHNIGTTYADTQLASYYCAGSTKGACALVRILEGSMPAGAGCTGNPVTDSGNAACLTASEQATLQAWISGGQLP